TGRLGRPSLTRADSAALPRGTSRGPCRSDPSSARRRSYRSSDRAGSGAAALALRTQGFQVTGRPRTGHLAALGPPAVAAEDSGSTPTGTASTRRRPKLVAPVRVLDDVVRRRRRSDRDRP